MKAVKFIVGLLVGVLLIVLPLSQLQPSALDPLQTLAVQLDGRKKPLDTVALETVGKLHGALSYRQADGTKLDYLQTYLALEFNDRDWNTEPFLLVSYRPLKEAVGLDIEQKYFSFRELIASPELGSLVRQAHQKELREEDLTRNEREAITVEDRLKLILDTVSAPSLPIVPHPSDAKGLWVDVATAGEYYGEPEVDAIAQAYGQLKQAYRVHPEDLTTVSALSLKLHEALANLSPTVYPATRALQQEVHFHRFHPFGKAWPLYLLAFGIVGLSFFWPTFDFYWTGIGLFAAGVLVQAYGFWLRTHVAGRPPVTNMYESVVWVGFGIAAVALLFELTSRARYYLLAAAPLATVCLLLADRLPAVLDPSIGPLVPVLRDNFWLSVHVPTITLSYACFALAMGLGHVSLGHYLFAPGAKQRLQKLGQFNYHVLQAGVLLLTTGIILGGIWAHFSWGRFWGWDPKETWALIALLCYLVPLHGRLVGWFGNFGITVA
ncbi:MAG: cytochrome c biogenesis protein CcsA, partial [Cyanobacteria bacterium P01_H01_bin.121]